MLFGWNLAKKQPGNLRAELPKESSRKIFASIFSKSTLASSHKIMVLHEDSEAKESPKIKKCLSSVQ